MGFSQYFDEPFGDSRAITLVNDNQLLRYSRHILLPKIGYEGQEKIVNSHALIAPVAMTKAFTLACAPT